MATSSNLDRGTNSTPNQNQNPEDRTLSTISTDCSWKHVLLLLNMDEKKRVVGDLAMPILTMVVMVVVMVVAMVMEVVVVMVILVTVMIMF